ncbi:ribosome biogenesis GTPase A [Alicyclobacillus contaminans]|uniref:ribosome biogenesis GTPase YlqF n=1 Tax=Alicyclobacillus contaminans TaxID=392016 RepID=UPI00040A5FBC|nr:ribosome biogenesis GTPase YlqF [Alicyclobacillus contaminans]GMA49061.1 ribosome biogenesis GTPase A [Alicyclobacillus contaminans]
MQPIHWFPGHMAKARREMAESIARVDAVVEVLDARIPHASANPMLQSLIGRKPKVVVLTRADLADPTQTAGWETHLRREGHQVVTLDARTGRGVQRVLPALEAVASEKRAKDAKRGIRPRPLKVMVVGIPNVGKSSLINRLAGRSATNVGDRPGITKMQQWIRLGQVELLDTPGVLWPKLEEEHVAHTLAITGAIKSEILDKESLFAYFAVWCSTHYPRLLADRYGVPVLPETAWSGVAEVWDAVEPLLAAIGRQRGLMQSGGVVDTGRAAELVLRELQTGKLGRVTLEWAPTSAAWENDQPERDE